MEDNQMHHQLSEENSREVSELNLKIEDLNDLLQKKEAELELNVKEMENLESELKVQADQIGQMLKQNTELEKQLKNEYK
jgi:ribosomal protein S3